ncbi:preprotein translocase, secretion protein SecA subunit [Legionella nautarum]|uniref:Preprotein translocase, secretion protein SecA subunit n=1 Tax=Legionella nautarum TaxID=45070 RepID=A0A0W0WIW1_9GAMM|nr:hypothetical protein [Legionella nautarum]KTD32258.1 preprotein translocase, secretion protein SecA subunit [Legionella nautarum]
MFSKACSVSLFAPPVKGEIENQFPASFLFDEPDYFLLQEKAEAWIKKAVDEKKAHLWAIFCQQLNLLQTTKSVKRMLLQMVLSCFLSPIDQGELAQLIVLATHIQSLYGERLFQALFTLQQPVKAAHIGDYLTACQLLVDLHEQPGIFKLVKETMPDTKRLVEKLEEMHISYLGLKYPERDIEETLSRFAQQSELVQFPLSTEELETLKTQYAAVKATMKSLNTLPLLALQERAKACAAEWKEKQDTDAKHQLIAIISETIRRTYKISPYDTQILSVLALINTPEKLKGRIAQIKTGEGKSTIIAMLAAFMGCQGNFVDIVTSSPDLAIRDAEKYAPFFEALGLTVSHICDHHGKEEDFSGQILYGTNTDFEFAMLRDGLNNTKLRQSKRDGVLQDRTFDVVIVDEVDNLFLDTALNSALLSIPGKEDITWIYTTILDYVRKHRDQKKSLNDMAIELHHQLFSQFGEQYGEILQTLNDRRLKKWLVSAMQALYQKEEGKDYVVKSSSGQSAANSAEHEDIVIVDYINTGRLNEGSQWKDGLHQFLQAKHGLPITPESLTAASLAHPTYFGLYQLIMGLTGTMGEAVEREEIQKIYGVDSFDVPPHFPSQREHLPDFIFKTEEEKHQQLLKYISEIQSKKRPSLVLFKTIKESEQFSELLRKQGIKHQLINENQREAEEYLVSRAGEESMITIATNTAGRGTDILLSPESKEAGGLHVIFTFYPNNLRVQGQGGGRAARQGQPGSYNMMLSFEDDDYIKALFEQLTQNTFSQLVSHNDDNASEFHDFHVLLSSLKTGVFPAAEIITILDKLRTKSIQKESERRYQCSQQEVIYFEKLQDFFIQLNALNQLLQDAVFKENFIKICTTGELDGTEISPFCDEDGAWKQVHEAAKLLISNQCKGLEVDWSGFYDQFKRSWLSNARRQWALFYNKLHDEIEDGDIGTVKMQVEQAQTKSSTSLNNYLFNPGEKIVSVLQSILYSAYQEISHDLEPVNHFQMAN